MVLITRCAPKLGPILYDPLAFGDDNYNTENKNQPPLIPIATNIILRQLNTTDARVPCNGYDFDALICKMINNRILCGYNKNLGQIENNQEIVDVGNGCRMRGDRMECGYENAPFNGIRRPEVQEKETARHRPSREGVIEKLKRTVVNTASSSYATYDDEETTKSESKTNISNSDTGNNSTLIVSSSTDATSNITDSNDTSARTTNNTTTKISKEKSDVELTTSIDTTDIQSTTETSRTIEIESNSQNMKTLDIQTTLLNTTKMEPISTETTRINKVETTTTLERKTTNNMRRYATMCVEKQDRIVCYELPRRTSELPKRMKRRYLVKY